MGTSLINYQIRTGDTASVESYLERSLRVPAYLSAPKAGWVSLYISTQSRSQEPDPSRFAKKLSKNLDACVFAFFLYDSDVFQYWMYENGELSDQYNSDPSYDSDRKASRKMLERWRGKPERLQKFCRPGTSLEQIEKCLHPETPPVFADDTLLELAQLLGIDEDHAHQSFGDIEAEESVGQDVTAFKLIEAKVSQKYKDDALQRAAMFGQIDKVRELIASGADVHCREEYTEMPLFIRAVEMCYPAVIEALINAGANVNVTAPEIKDGKTKIFATLGRGTIFPYPWESGVTPLMVAAGHSLENNSALEVVQMLLVAGADVHAVSELGRTAMKEAVAMTKPKAHQGRIGRIAPEHVLQEAAARSAQIVELLRQASA